jgi:TonB family protein
MRGHTKGAIFFIISSLCIAKSLGASKAELAARYSERPSQAAAKPPTQDPNTFSPAALVSATDVQYPLDTTMDGVVVFGVSLDASGAKVNLNSLSDIPPLTSAAQSSLQSWKFSSASQKGIAVPSRMLVAFVFRHAIKMGDAPEFQPVFPIMDPAGYTPPGISSVTYAEYPTDTVAAGASVIQVTVKADGKLGETNVVRSMNGGFDPLVLQAAKTWQIKPAMLNGISVTSKVAIAFVFSSRAQNPF